MSSKLKMPDFDFMQLILQTLWTLAVKQQAFYTPQVYKLVCVYAWLSLSDYYQCHI